MARIQPKGCSLLILGVWERPVISCQPLEWESPLTEIGKICKESHGGLEKSIF